MGIAGLWEELAPAASKQCISGPQPLLFERSNYVLALVALTAEKFAATGDPLKVAIDVSIWTFQIQAGKKGSNPALRTFYYRLCRLLKLHLRPLFVFDGPCKPPFKRNERKMEFTGTADRWETRMVKALIKAFGYDVWCAPGEAEAECAMLQSRGLVDLVLTEDVDCLMFGAVTVARELSGEDRNAVVIYQRLEETTGLDRDSLVLIAMMSGGDYLPSGLSGFGPKLAVEVPLSFHLVTDQDCAGGVCDIIYALYNS